MKRQQANKNFDREEEKQSALNKIRKTNEDKGIPIASAGVASTGRPQRACREQTLSNMKQMHPKEGRGTIWYLARRC